MNWIQNGYDYLAKNVDVRRPCEPRDVLQAYLAGACDALQNTVDMDRARLQAAALEEADAAASAALRAPGGDRDRVVDPMAFVILPDCEPAHVAAA